MNQPSCPQPVGAAKKKIARRERFLAEMEHVAPWTALPDALAPHDFPLAAGRRGRPPVGLERMLRMSFVQQWYALADEATEDALYDSRALSDFPPTLLRGVEVVRPNQIWSTDITYIRLTHGFAYLVAIIDWYLRRVLAWRLSNTLEGIHPLVEIRRQVDAQGVTLTQGAMKAIEARWERHPTLPTGDILIRPNGG